MKVFISSVRRGLEEERDALPGLISVLKHTPRRFEDFTTQSVPSRQVCVDGVRDSDAYLLLIGPHYGHLFEDSGQSPTHEEWTTAQSTGIPRMVFVKENITMDDDQVAFYRSISNYTSGVFYNSFTTTADLLTKVAEALTELADRPGPLSWTPLEAPVDLAWRRDFDPQVGSNYASSLRAQLEVHVVGVPASQRSARQMGDLKGQLPGRIRTARIVDDAQPVDVTQEDDGSLLVVLPPVQRPRGGLHQMTPASLTGLRIGRSGQVSIWGSLPADGLGSVVDEGVVAQQIATYLRAVGALQLVPAKSLAVAVGVDNATMLTVGRVADMPRSSGQMSMSSAPIQLHPDELVTAAALGIGADEAAQPLARALAAAVGRRR